MAYPIPDKPSIAVMPFLNMTGDQSQEFFSDGVSESLITALSKIPQLFVIARDTTFSYKGKAVKVNQVSEGLGVQYVLEGSVQKAGDRVRVTAQLIDALKGYHLWAEHYDRELKDLFPLLDDITKNIINAINVKLTFGESGRVFAKGTENLEAYLKATESLWYVSKGSREGQDRARQLANEAIEFASAVEEHGDNISVQDRNLLEHHLSELAIEIDNIADIYWDTTAAIALTEGDDDEEFEARMDEEDEYEMVDLAELHEAGIQVIDEEDLAEMGYGGESPLGNFSYGPGNTPNDGTFNVMHPLGISRAGSAESLVSLGQLARESAE